MHLHPLENKDQTSDYLDKTNGLQQKKRIVRLSLWVLLLVITLAIFLANWELENKGEVLKESIQNRLQILAKGRVDVLSNWLLSLSTQGNQIIQSDLFRLYASEIDLIEEDIVHLLVTPVDHQQQQPPQNVTHLSEQLPLMQTLLEEFTQYSGFASGRIINRSGQSYIATDANTVPLDPHQTSLAKMAIDGNKVIYSPAKATGNGLFMQIYLPIKAPSMADPQERPIAALQLNKNISGKINEILSKAPLIDKGEKTRLLQQEGQQLVELVPWLPGEIFPLSQASHVELELSFGQRPSPRDQREVFSLAMKIPQLDWWILQETDYAQAISPANSHRRATISIIALGSLLLLVLIGALWWKLIGVENRKMAEAFKQLAAQIDEQRQLLDNINGNLSEYIGLKDNRGLYLYVNQAFADVVGRPQNEIIGLDDAAIFGFDSAKRLAHSDNKVIESRQQVTLNEELYLQSQRYDLQISKVPYVSSDGNISGIISSFRDVTEQLKNQKRSEKATRQTIEVLAKAVELNDPYLAGHSQLMSLFAVEMAKNMNCSESIQATVETASFLSQLGKMFVNPQLLQKPAVLTDDEKDQVEKHVEHAVNILQDIDFDLPICETILQMNEHLDGSGYPAGLKNEEINKAARILGVSNSFCAMIQPRSYRPARHASETLEVLKGESHKYDLEVIAALDEVVNSAIGERIITSIHPSTEA